MNNINNMENNWESGVYGAIRVSDNRYEFKHHNGVIVIFDSKQELDEYLEEYHLMTCELSQTS